MLSQKSSRAQMCKNHIKSQFFSKELLCTGKKERSGNPREFFKRVVKSGGRLHLVPFHMVPLRRTVGVCQSKGWHVEPDKYIESNQKFTTFNLLLFFVLFFVFSQTFSSFHCRQKHSGWYEVSGEFVVVLCPFPFQLSCDSLPESGVKNTMR